MTRFQFILKTLYNKTLKTSEIVDIYYDEYSELVDEKRRWYISKNNEKTEKELRTQLIAEFSSYINRTSNKSFFTKLGEGYTLSDEGKSYYDNNFVSNQSEFETEDIEVEITEEQIKEQFEKRGIIYLLKSKTFEGVYKIGKTTDLKTRMSDLKKDHKYGVFDLELLMYIDCQDYSIIERVFHKFFEDFRLCKKKQIKVDTELFKDNDTIIEEFKLFADFLIKNPRFQDVKLNIIS
jgi:hypothetical protein